jgi:hypothetical protein
MRAESQFFHRLTLDFVRHVTQPGTRRLFTALPHSWSCAATTFSSHRLQKSPRHRDWDRSEKVHGGRKLCEIEGIGKASQQIIEEYIAAEKHRVREVAASVPKGLWPLLSIEGLGRRQSTYSGSARLRRSMS